MQLAEVGEFGFIERIARQITPQPGVGLGIGDDCAVTTPQPGRATLTTTDLLVEGVHFDLATTDPGSLGHKSLAVNLSDIAAMGGVPRHVLLGLAIPPTTPVEFLDRFTESFLALAERHGVTLIGGDTCASRPGLLIAVTLLGDQEPERVVTRAGARPGDLIVVSGTVGDSARGLVLLQGGAAGARSATAAAEFCLARHLAPTARVELGRLLAEAGLATAMIDVSDGVIADLGHILDRSGVGARLELARLPLSAAYRELAATAPGNLWELAATGGEDYELLFTIPPGRAADLAVVAGLAGVPLTIIGTISAEKGLRPVDDNGVAVTFARRGYNHFAGI